MFMFMNYSQNVENLIASILKQLLSINIQKCISGLNVVQKALIYLF